MMLSNLGSLNRFGAAASLGSLEDIVDAPSVSTIARTADTMDLDAIRGGLKEIYLAARKKKMIGDYYGKAVGILDGHEVTSSYISKCEPLQGKKCIEDRGGGKTSALPQLCGLYTGWRKVCHNA